MALAALLLRSATVPNLDLVRLSLELLLLRLLTADWLPCVPGRLYWDEMLYLRCVSLSRLCLWNMVQYSANNPRPARVGCGCGKLWCVIRDLTFDTHYNFRFVKVTPVLSGR